MWLVIALLAGGYAVSKIVSSESGPDNKAPTAPEITADGIPTVTSLELSTWSSSGGAPADKLNNRGEKFMDPYAIQPCLKFSHANTGGMAYLLAAPKDGKSRMTLVHTKAKTTPAVGMPAADALISMAGAMGVKTLTSVGADLKARIKWWSAKINEYARSTGNGYVIALAALYTWFLSIMPVSWQPEFKRARALSEVAAENLQSGLLTNIAMSIPYPLHVLSGDVTGKLAYVQHRSQIINDNAKKVLALPNSAKAMMSAWFALLISMIADDKDVQSAVTVVDNHEWGMNNLASDEMVYLVGTVFARSIGADPLKFSIDLWNRSKGWNRFPQLLSNSYFVFADTANGGKAGYASQSNGGFTYNQTKQPVWRDWPVVDGFSGGSSCAFTNARQVQYFELILTGWEMVAEYKGLPSPIKSVKLEDLKLTTILPR